MLTSHITNTSTLETLTSSSPYHVIIIYDLEIRPQHPYQSARVLHHQEPWKILRFSSSTSSLPGVVVTRHADLIESKAWSTLLRTGTAVVRGVVKDALRSSGKRISLAIIEEAMLQAVDNNRRMEDWM